MCREEKLKFLERMPQIAKTGFNVMQNWLMYDVINMKNIVD